MEDACNKEILTVSEVSKILGLHKITVYSWARKGILPNYRIGSGIRIMRSELDQWLKERRRG